MKYISFVKSYLQNTYLPSFRNTNPHARLLASTAQKMKRTS